MEPGRPSEGEEGEAPRVHAPAHGHDADPFRHHRVDDAVDAVGGRDALGAQSLGDPVHRPLGGGPVEPRPPAEEVAGIEVAEDEVRVGDGGRRAPLPVAGRTRIGARALRPDAEDPARVDARDRAAPGPDRHDVQARERDLLAGHPAVAREVSLAPLDQRDVGARPAHVEGDEVPLAEEARRVAAARHPAGRARQHGAGGEADRVDDRRDPAVRLDDEDGARVAGADQSLAEAREVSRERGAHVGVDDGRADPLVLLDLREHLGRQRDVRPRQSLPERRLRRPLVAAVAVGVEVADGDRLHARPPETLDGRAERPEGEGRLDPSVGAEPLPHPEPTRPRHERLGRGHAQVVAVVLEPLAHLDDVPVALGREEADPRPLPLEERVGRDRRPVHDPLGLAQEGAHVEVELLGEQPEPLHDADGGIGGSRGRLGEDDPPRVVDGDHVREGPPDVDPDPVHVSASSRGGSRARSPRRRPARRPAAPAGRRSRHPRPTPPRTRRPAARGSPPLWS